MTKPLKPLNQFIKEYLPHDYAKLADNLNANNHQLLAEADSYLEYQREYPITQIISLKIKLFEYYSCMRLFQVANLLQAEITNLLTDCETKLISGFESAEFRAEFLLLQGIQTRNHKPVVDFVKSEELFIRSEEIYLALYFKENHTPTRNYYMNEYFRALMNRLGLYVNYDNQPLKATDLIAKINKLIETTLITNSAYLSLYYFCAGSYYLNTNQNELAVSSLTIATNQLRLAPEAFWAQMEYKDILEKRLQSALEVVGKNATSKVAPDAFFQGAGGLPEINKNDQILGMD